MTAQLVVLGATGDLAARYLLPALARVVEHVEGGVHLVGVAADDFDAAGFREHVRTVLAQEAPDTDAAVRDGIADRADWVRGDVTDGATLAEALGHTGFEVGPRAASEVDPGTEDPVVLYLALPNGLFDDVVAALGRTEHPPRLRLVVEKPFGQDEASARALNAALARVVPEELIFRVDHFLAKQTVLEHPRACGSPTGCSSRCGTGPHIESVDIVFDETVDAQARAAYYDRAGALRDMVQNHLLQILSSSRWSHRARPRPGRPARRKVDVLRAVRTCTPEEVAARTPCAAATPPGGRRRRGRPRRRRLRRRARGWTRPGAPRRTPR